MEICGKREMELLEKIGFTRIAGSPEEEKAAQILKEECDKLGVPAIIQPFEIEQGIVEEATLEILEPFQQEMPRHGLSVRPEHPGRRGWRPPFLYVENADDVSLSDARGKIVLVNGYMRVPLFRKLMKAGVAGIVTMEGQLRDKREETDLSTRKLRRTLRAFGNVPMVHTRVLDAIDMVRKGACKGPPGAEGPHRGVDLSQRDRHGAGHREARGDRLLWRPLRLGGLLQGRVRQRRGQRHQHGGAALFAENPPKRTLKFVWYGSEEIGLEGSWAYVKAHKEELEAHKLMINVDVGGPVLGVDRITATAEKALASYLEYFVKIHGFAAEVKQGIYSSDSIPFAGQRRARGELQPGRRPRGGLHPRPVRHPLLPFGGYAGEDHPHCAGVRQRDGERRPGARGAEDSPEHRGGCGENTCTRKSSLRRRKNNKPG